VKWLKRLLRWIGKRLLMVLLVALAFKAAQTICWRNQVRLVPPPSLDSWDPTERVEAAWEAARKYGGGKE